MDFKEFEIGSCFHIQKDKWLCIDIGTKTIIGLRVKAQKRVILIDGVTMNEDIVPFSYIKDNWTMFWKDLVVFTENDFIKCKVAESPHKSQMKADYKDYARDI